MSFASAVKERDSPSASEYCCKVGKVYATMNDEDRTAFDYALEKVVEQMEWPQYRRYFTIEWLTKSLNDNGYRVGRTTLKDHIHRGHTL